MRKKFAAPKKPKKEKKKNGIFSGLRLGVDFDYLIGGLTQLFVALLAIGIVLYFGQYLYSTLFAGVSTASVSRISETLTAEGTAFLIRDETPIRADRSGYPSYLVADGAKVAKGDGVVGFYPKDVGSLERELESVRAEEALLTRSMTGNGVLDALKDVSSTYEDLMKQSAAGNWSAYCGLSDAFREKLNRRASHTDTGASLATQLETLQKKEAELKASIGDASRVAAAPAQGYFFYHSDGYAGSVSTDVIKGFTEETYRHLLSLQPEDTSGQYGVLVPNQKWYLAVSLEGTAAAEFAAGRSCRVIFSDSREIGMTVKTAIRTADGMILLLGADVIPADFSWERVRTVKIACGEVSGYRIPTSALHTEDGITGVYVLQGKTVCFRRIEILREGTGYCVAAPREESTPQPKTFRVISYPSVANLAATPQYQELAVSRGVHRKCAPWDGSLGAGTQSVNGLLFLQRGKRGEPLSYRDTSPYYAYLDGLESVIISGRDLYHGKVVG